MRKSNSGLPAHRFNSESPALEASISQASLAQRDWNSAATSRLSSSALPKAKMPATVMTTASVNRNRAVQPNAAGRYSPTRSSTSPASPKATSLGVIREPSIIRYDLSRTGESQAAAPPNAPAGTSELTALADEAGKGLAAHRSSNGRQLL